MGNAHRTPYYSQAAGSRDCLWRKIDDGIIKRCFFRLSPSRDLIRDLICLLSVFLTASSERFVLTKA